MKLLRCIPCARTQKDGKFCLDCGRLLTETTTKNINFTPIKTVRSPDRLKQAIRNHLQRIGVKNPDIQISTGQGAEVTYSLDGKSYRFKSVLQVNDTCNLAAVEQFVNYRVLGIERGIETTEQAFKGYEALPDPTAHLQSMSDEELRRELKFHHPDTGTGDKYQWEKLMKEKQRRESL